MQAFSSRMAVIAIIGEVMTIPFERFRVGEATPEEFRAQIMEDPEYYTLRNYALDFLYNRFAHAEGA